MRIIFDEDKNKKLKRERAVSFEIVIEKMGRGEIILDFKHPNTEKYPNQRIMIIEIDNYPYCVPYIQTKEEIVLKTIYPDRRFKKFIEKEDT
jgi:uncharacterized DUF497 family protein